MSHIPDFTQIPFGRSGGTAAPPSGGSWQTPEGIAIKSQYGVEDVAGIDFLDTHLFRPIHWLAYLLPWNWFREQAPRGARIRRALEDLGPIFVKFGQILSTRADLLPDDIACELKRLQDRVPPFDGNQAADIIEHLLPANLFPLA